MSAPPWAGGPAFSRTRNANPNLRVSDADRAEVADRLSEHYGAGRLDEDEFHERLDKAMKAKTESDLAGLFADLPGGEAQAPAPQRQRRRRHRLLFLVLIVVIAAAAGRALVWWYFSWLPWLLIAMVAFFLLRRDDIRHRS